MALANEIKTPRALGYAFMAKGTLSAYLEDDQQALRALTNAYDAFRKVGDYRNCARVAADISYEYAGAAIMPQVKKYALLALEDAQKAGTPEEILYARLAFGSYLIAQRRADTMQSANTAISYFRETIRLQERDSNAIYLRSGRLLKSTKKRGVLPAQKAIDCWLLCAPNFTQSWPNRVIECPLIP